MAKDLRAFLKVGRGKSEYRPVCERVKDYGAASLLRTDEKTQEQASRCMDCGTPFCHWACPVGSVIPEFNDLLIRGQWEKAFKVLSAANNLPEMTGRLCPALCEFSCVLGCNPAVGGAGDSAVTIRENELGLVEYAFNKKIIKPRPPKKRTGKKVAVIGSGPSGLACADQLNKMGHSITVFERDEKVGGILRFGIPDFKLEKNIVDRRINIYKKEGIEFKSGVSVGKDYPAGDLLKKFDAVALCLGSRTPRDLKIEGRELNGIYFAMDYLMQNNRRVAGQKIAPKDSIDAKGKKVVVIGGGDTGADCVGTANRQGASCVVQIELLPQPPENRPEDQPWPKYPLILKTSTSHEEGGERHWCVSTKKFTGTAGQVKKLVCVRVDVSFDAAKRMVVKELPGSQFEIEADLVLLAMGFLHPEHEGLLKDLGLALDERGNIKTAEDYMSSQKGIFAAGDARRGQSLVVWAIAEGRLCAESINRYLSK